MIYSKVHFDVHTSLTHTCLCIFCGNNRICFSFTDNWALLYAQRMALKQEVPLIVCFCLPSKYLHAAFRQYSFMITGLKEVEKVQDVFFLYDRLANNTPSRSGNPSLGRSI